MIDRNEIKSIARQRIDGKKAVYIFASIIVSVIVVIASFTILGHYILIGPLTLGLTIVTMKIVRGEEVQVSNVFDGFKEFLSGLVAFLLQTLFLCGWFLLFIIPGFIKVFSYSMTYYILVDNPEMSVSEAITKSREMMNGHKLDLFVLQLTFIGWYLLCILTLGIALIYVAPYVATTKALFYEKLKEQN